MIARSGLSVLGSTREIVWSSRFATHTDPDPNAIAPGRVPTATCPTTRLVSVSIAANELGEAGCDVRDPNLGGTVEFDWGWVKLVPAWHTSTTPKGTANTPAGLVISFGGKVVYHLGDTCLFSDLSLVGRRHPIDVALMCIGGHYTMDRHDAVEAAKLVGAGTVIPCHYNTFPPIETDAQAFASDVRAAGAGEVVVLEPGQSHAV